MMLQGQVFAERVPMVSDEERSNAAEQVDFSEVNCREYGTLPQETIARLGLRHVCTMPVVLGNGRDIQVPIYRAEVLWQKQWRTIYVCEGQDIVAR